LDGFLRRYVVLVEISGLRLNELGCGVEEDGILIGVEV